MKSLKKMIPLSLKRQIREILGISDHTDHRQVLLELLPKHAVGAEIGVHKGDFSQYLLDRVAPKKLHLIDPWQSYDDEVYLRSWYGQSNADQTTMDDRYNLVVKRFQEQINQDIVKIHRSSSIEAVEDFSDEYFDWVYIDGNHLYEFVFQDLENFYGKVKNGGILAGDDYNIEGWWDNGVTKAVDEFVKKYNLELNILGSQFLIKKSS